MKALVLDGSHGGDQYTITAARDMARTLRDEGYEVEHIVLRDMSIAPCNGCFGCWTRTPGECVVSDSARDVAASFVASDLVALVTPVTFGGYSSELKKALDRIIPVLDPRFVKIDGEMHHKKRYPRYPQVVALGTLPAPDPEAEAAFHKLAERNGRNLHTKVRSDVVVGTATDGVGADAARGLVAWKAVA